MSDKVCVKRWSEGCSYMMSTGYGDAHECDLDATHDGPCVCPCGAVRNGMTPPNGDTPIDAQLAAWERWIKEVAMRAALPYYGAAHHTPIQRVDAALHGLDLARADMRDAIKHVHDLTQLVRRLQAAAGEMGEENDRLLASLESADAQIAALTPDFDRYHALREQYIAADFADAQAPGQVVLKFAFPAGLKVSANADETLDRAIALLPKLEATHV